MEEKGIRDGLKDAISWIVTIIGFLIMFFGILVGAELMDPSELVKSALVLLLPIGGIGGLLMFLGLWLQVERWLQFERVRGKPQKIQ